MSSFVVIQSCTVWVKKSPPPKAPDIFSFSHKRLRIFNRFFTHLLYVPIYARLQIFVQLSPILTKLCHIKRDYPVHVKCWKCPPLAKTHAFRRLRKLICWLLSVASHYKINTFIMPTNMLDKTWRQQWRHLLSKQTWKLSFSEMWKFARWSRLVWYNFVKVGDIWTNICSLV